MANRMPMQPGDGSNPSATQPFYYSQNGTPPQQMYLNFPIAYPQLQVFNAQQLQYQTFVESQRRAQPDMRSRGQQQQQLPGHPPQPQQAAQQQQQQRVPGMSDYPTGHPAGGLEQGEGFDQKSQAEKDAMLEFIRTEGAAGKMFQQRGPPPPQQQQQQQQQRMPFMLSYPTGSMERDAGFESNGQGSKDPMAELMRGRWGPNKTTQQRNPAQQQQQQQQQRQPGMPGFPTGHSGGVEQGDGFEQKTQAEKDALLDLLRTQSGPSKLNPQQRGPQQQRPGVAPSIGDTLPVSAVGPHLDPAIAAAIPSGSPPAASNMQMSAGPAAAGGGGVGAGGIRSTPPMMSAAMAGGGPAAATRGRIEVDDEYGLKPLVKVLTAAPVMSANPHVPLPDEPTDPTTGRPISQQEADEINFSFITRGFDITQLGLSVSQQEWLHPTLATLPLDTHNYFILPEFKIPDSYKKPRPRSLSMKSFHQFKEETLFYIFYSMPRDVLHLAAARALYERGWRYNKREQHWFHPVKMDDGTLMEKVTAGPDRQKIFTGVYNVFHPNEWKQVRTVDNYTVSSNDVEEQSVLVAAMEEAARQQTQRSKAKAAQAATGTANNGSGSPANAAPAPSAEAKKGL
ncbi:hypothetical protein ABB37_08316 [Leptomonas pyrrhocoris]|uniref:NOT2/NOT3/NOT5 C-terminal domain-containing protein n=1 Tax=Leptomonas pyrrhocoris TaxID=157538 RepID=A0A0M9FTJ9_LEPPY|nr:hypothetical protein ABB37_08316 [Leptomonas pyrrhocoris]XP_015654230.1 hypothetical protein ABB37_08316 [Leptomonas pyrrhocoris]KPA75790.1 hypothetical protein ABB37_08316 [Leptomonas pyrrhocoris]KPA75791.1 hypothetical protein ABB37_08316 [Leptomonas pyrrhocoris]|eukprot:XP_015654229.1 hypothetical protein ABB37_08316 [Leptomonas pyrrhocoris]